MSSAHIEVDEQNSGSGGVGNEMAKRVRELDWSATPLGPSDTWPQSLQAPVRILLTSRFAMWMGWGPDLTFLYNDAYRRMTLGKKHPRALGRPAREVWEEIWTEIQPRIDQVLRGGVATWDESLMLFLERSGYSEETYHTFSYSPLSDEDGTISGMLCVVSEDTDRVIGERRLGALQDLAGALSTVTGEEEVIDGIRRSIGRNSKDVPFALLYLYESDGGAILARRVAEVGIQDGHRAAPRIIPVSAPGEATVAGWPAAEIYSGSARQVIGDLATQFGVLPTGAWDIPPHEALIVPILQPAQEKPAGFLVCAINPYRQLDDAYTGFIELIAGQVASSLANARAQEKERRRAESLAELDRAKTQFFSNVSHEFRTPLTLILGPTEQALAAGGAGRDELDVIHRNSMRLLKLVNTLLDFSRIEAGRIDARYVPTDIGKLTNELASAFRSAIEKAGLELKLESAPLDPPAFVDRDMWEKIVLNLVSNAFKHTFSGSIRVAVHQSDSAHAELIVEDTGIGIPADQVEHLFERFYRVPNARSRTYEGTGIGLSLVQELVRLHGGLIDVASEEERGTSFRVLIPLGSAHLPNDHVASEPLEIRPERRASGSSAFTAEALRWLPGKSLGDEEVGLFSDESVQSADPRAEELAGARILLVDDNADMRDYAGRLLRGNGWIIETAADGATALEMAKANPPDLVLSDVMMPGIDGFELLRALRADPATQLVPLILLSARAGDEARVEGLDSGADDYLVKPFSAQELVARVRSHLTLARTREAATRAVAEARDQLVRVLAQAPVAVLVVRGPNHIVELANPSYRALTGNRDLVGRPFAELFDGPDVASLIATLDGVYNTGEPFVGRRIPVAFDREGDGVIVPGYFNFTSYPLSEDGKIVGVITVATEITDEVLAKEFAERAQGSAERARRDAEDARQEAETANRAKSDFLAAMSHELRTPLNAIAGYVELVEMGIHGPITDAQREVLGRVRRSEHHLLALINDVLNFAKLEAGRVEYVLRTFDLGDIVSQTAPIIEPQFEAKKITFEWRVPNGLEVWADEDKVRQVLINLLTNAVKFTEVSGKVTVDAATREDGDDGGRPDAIFLRVTDTGIGIPIAKQQTIFDPFVQLHRDFRRTPEGTGLGLSISRDLARGMGGELRVRSREGRGSTFTLTLPRPNPAGA